MVRQNHDFSAATESKPAYLYARFSSLNQKESSIERQLTYGRVFAENHGWAVVEELRDEGKSAFKGANRHLYHMHEVETGKVEVVEELGKTKDGYYRQDQITRGTLEAALAAGERTRQEVGEENLGPWDDFEWGMLNGKLSALRWVTGSEWDFLDT